MPQIVFNCKSRESKCFEHEVILYKNSFRDSTQAIKWAIDNAITQLSWPQFFVFFFLF